MNKKGFTLIELIIVIAIMAILVGVLAPNLLRYIERSRYAADVQLADSILTAANAATADMATDPYMQHLTALGPGGILAFSLNARVSIGVSDVLTQGPPSYGENVLGKALRETLGYPDLETLVSYEDREGLAFELRSSDFQPENTEIQLAYFYDHGFQVRIIPMSDPDKEICLPKGSDTW